MAIYGSTDLEIVARTVYGEARGESWEGKVAVAHVILNRAKKRHAAPAREAQRPWQFSCWNPNDPNREELMDVGPGDKTFRDCMSATLAAISGIAPDVTNGALHYHAEWLTPPEWADGKEPCLKIGGHIFYNDVAL